MTKPEATSMKTNRILVALDTSARGQAALRFAVRIASHTSAELQGLFVEDEDLIRLASLPFAREVDLASASPRQLRSRNMERALHAAAEEAQRAFSNALQELNLRWTFRVVRGTVTRASLAAAGDVDLLIIGQRGRCPRIVEGDYLPGRAASCRPVVVFDGSPSAYRSLEFASRLTDPNSPPLSVLVLAEDGDEVSRRCISWLQQHGIRAEVDQVLHPSQAAIVDFVRKWPPPVLLISRDCKFISDSQLHQLVNEFDCPLILC